MHTKKRKALIIGTLAASSLAVAALSVAYLNNADYSLSKVNADTYSVALGGSNGNASVSSLKTNSVTAKTAAGNDVVFNYKNMQVVSGKVGTILAKGSYYNKEPLNAMNKIKVTSNASAGKATLYWGPTSGYMPNSVDLADAKDDVVVSGNYFKIAADDEVTIDSINVKFDCDEKDYGFYALDKDGNFVEDGFVFTYETNSYAIRRNHDDSSKRSAVVTAIIPDYYDDGVNGLHPVTMLGAQPLTNLNYGTFEGYSNLKEIYLPNTIVNAQRYTFSCSGVDELSLPLYFEEILSSNTLPSNLKVLNLNSISLSAVSAVISSSSAIRTINVSYDVEKLPKIASSWPSDLVINYEGTTAEWSSLLSASGSDAAWSSFAGDVICSDTTISTVTFSYEGATIGSDADYKSVSVITGKAGAVVDPGTPVHPTLRFVGWFDAAVGGNPIELPTTANSDMVIYAHFEEYPAGASVANPINVALGNSYDFHTADDAKYAYFRYTAEVDTVLFARVAAGSTDYVYLKAITDQDVEISCGNANSAAGAASASPVRTSSYGVGEVIKVRVAAGESAYLKFGDDSARAGDITIDFSATVANDGKDFTTAINGNSGSVAIENVGQKGMTWISFTPETTDDYLITNSATAWVGGDMGTISDNTFSAITSGSELNSSGSPKSTLKHLEAGTTYYVAIRSNGNNHNATITFSNDIPETYSRSTAKLIVANGTDETVTYVDSTFATRWFKFVVADTGSFRLTSSSHSVTASMFKLYAGDSTEEIPFVAGRTSNDKVYESLTAGTYYLSVLTSSTNNSITFNVAPVVAAATVTVYANGPEAAATSSTEIDAGSTFELDNPSYVKNGHTYYTGFEGWFTDSSFNTPFVSGSVINEDTSIYAKLSGTYQNDVLNDIAGNDSDGIIASLYTVGEYDVVASGDDIISSNNGVHNSSSGFAIVLAKAATISFDYTVSSENNYDKIKVDTRASVGSTTANKLTDSGSKTSSFELSLEAGNVAEIYFYKDGSGNSGDDMMTISNLSFKTVAAVELTYNFNNGGITVDQTVEVLPGNAITKISDPSWEGHRFIGWFTEAEEGETFNFSAGITANTTIYAHWAETITVTIYGDGPDADPTEVKIIDKGSSITLSDLNTTYYHGFEGWFTDAECSNEITSGTVVSESMSIYAKHAGKYRMDDFNNLDATFAGIFSDISGTNNAYHMVYDSVANTLTSGNKGANNQTSSITLVLKEETAVSFDYYISSESGWDKGTISYEVSGVTTKVVNDGSGTVNGSFSQTLPAGAIIKIYYTKDSSGASGDDMLRLSNLSFVKVA